MIALDAGFTAMTRTSCFAFAAIAFAAIGLVACGGAQRSRWTPNAATDTPYFICKCDGVERQPKPHEAADYHDDERVDLVCEGKVRDCHRGSLETPGASRGRNVLPAHGGLD